MSWIAETTRQSSTLSRRAPGRPVSALIPRYRRSAPGASLTSSARNAPTCAYCRTHTPAYRPSPGRSPARLRHRDSVGSDVVVRPGQLNLMTGGRGVAYSEFSVGDAPMLHAPAAMVALPAASSGIEPSFEQHPGLPTFERAGLRATVFVGTLDGAASLATVHTRCSAPPCRWPSH